MSNKKDNNIISRRQFMTVTGGAVGLATLASMGLSSGWGPNTPEVDIDQITSSVDGGDVLVIGGGMAGLFAAVKAHDAGAKVLLVSKGRFGSSGLTPFGKGVFAYDPKTAQVSLDEFVDMVSHSALGTSNPVYTRLLAEHSLARVKELREWGYFDSSLCYDAFNKPIDERNIPVKERIVITHLLKEDGRITGAAGFSLDEEKIHFFKAKSVILCTGSGGFKPNGFPVCELTHDGTIMAYNIGAKVTGKEWNDGHPGQATNAAACFDGWPGMFERKPSTTGVGVRHDLGVELNYRAYTAGNPIQMGPPGINESGSRVEGGPYRPTGFDRNRPPDSERGPAPKDKRPPQKKGGPPGMAGELVGGSSAGMSIHKSEGLVPINDRCESNIPGLYAAGDALGSHQSGGIYTQVGSSLAGSAVQGAIAAEAAAEYSRSVESLSISEAKMEQVRSGMIAPLKREAGYGPAWVTQTLQGIMLPNFVLYVKKDSILRAALAYIEELRDHHMPMLRAADMHELRLAHETGNMILNAEMKLRASIMRKESRCSHYRLDYPDMDTKNWNAWINLYKGADGSMQLEKQAFEDWPAG